MFARPTEMGITRASDSGTGKRKALTLFFFYSRLMPGALSHFHFPFLPPAFILNPGEGVFYLTLSNSHIHPGGPAPHSPGIFLFFSLSIFFLSI